MKLIHLCAAVSTAVVVMLLFIGAGDAAGVVFCSGGMIELIGSEIVGKQSNDGVR